MPEDKTKEILNQVAYLMHMNASNNKGAQSWELSGWARIINLSVDILQGKKEEIKK